MSDSRLGRSKKRQALRAERGASFTDLATAILDKGLLDILPHPQLERYPGQEIWSVVVERRGLTRRFVTAYKTGTIHGLKVQADKAGLRYQTLASAVLKQVASGNLEMRTVQAKRPTS